jgi:peptidoglycan hydrolase-like protein with peptidoglycan-binding domain
MIKTISDVRTYPAVIIRLTLLSILIGATALILSIFATRVHAYEVNIVADSNLTIGATGQNVVVLQGLLSELGYLTMPANVAPGYFGTLTKNALTQYQLSQGVSPSIGYFGPVTKIAMHQQFSSRGWLSMLGW